MTLTVFLQSVCDLLHNRTNGPATLGLPVNQASGLFVWPWRISENPELQTPPPNRFNRSVGLFDVHFLVFARPDLSQEGLSQFEAARQAILQSPIVTLGSDSVEMLMETLSNDELASLFTAAQMPITMCLCVKGRGVGQASPPVGPGVDVRNLNVG